MIPILYEKEEKLFNHNGICRLSDAINCHVTEERNGDFTLEMLYPVNGKHFKELKSERIIYATHDNSHEPQPFDIVRVVAPHSGLHDYITVYAKHISYRLEKVIAFAGGHVGDGPTAYINELNQPISAQTPGGRVFGQCDFTFSSDVDDGQFTGWRAGYMTSKNEIIRTILLNKSIGLLSERKYQGEKTSIQDTGFGDCGSFKWDKFSVTLMANRGADNGIKLRTGKNVKALTVESTSQDIVTACIPYWQGRHPISGDAVFVDLYTLNYHHEQITDVHYEAGVVYADITYPYQRTVLLDMSSVWEQPPTADELFDAAREYLRVHAYNESKSIASYKVTLTDMSDDVVQMQSADLCDWVIVQDTTLRENIKLQITSVTYDSIKDRYVSMIVGRPYTALPELIQRKNDIYVQKLGNVSSEVNDLANKTQVTTYVQPATTVGRAVNLVDENGEEVEKIATINRTDIYAHKSGGGGGSSTYPQYILCKFTCASSPTMSITPTSSGRVRVWRQDGTYATISVSNITVNYPTALPNSIWIPDPSSTADYTAYKLNSELDYDIMMQLNLIDGDGKTILVDVPMRVTGDTHTVIASKDGMNRGYFTYGSSNASMVFASCVESAVGRYSRHTVGSEYTYELQPVMVELADLRLTYKKSDCKAEIVTQKLI